jgi:hypothetical protein
MERRDFLKAAGVVAAASSLQAQRSEGLHNDREYWIAIMRRLADPVLNNLANGTLKARIPVEQGASDRRAVTHLEALGRLITGLAPWIELSADESAEGRLRAQYAALAHRAIGRAVDPVSPDFMNFTGERQPLVDAAFLASAPYLLAHIALRRALPDCVPIDHASDR